jgi:hypothetical protein
MRPTKGEQAGLVRARGLRSEAGTNAAPTYGPPTTLPIEQQIGRGAQTRSQLTLGVGLLEDTQHRPQRQQIAALPPGRHIEVCSAAAIEEERIIAV